MVNARYGEYVKRPNKKVRAKCRALVLRTAEKFDIPPAHITAHINSRASVAARKEVMLVMIRDLGLRRCQVAYAMNRDLRRVRASEIGGPRTRHGHTGPNYSQVDLLGNPLVSLPSEGTITMRQRYPEALKILQVAALESPTAERWLKELA